MRSRTGPVLILALCTGACSFDFTDLPNETRAAFSAHILADARTDQLDIGAALTPGHGTDAALRPIMTDLLVAGRPVPFSENNTGNRTYAAEWSLSAVRPADGWLEIRVPQLRGLPTSEAPMFALPLPVRTGPETVHVTAGDQVILDIALPELEDASAFWRVDVLGSDGQSRLALQSVGYPPGQIVLSRTWFGPGAASHRVRLHVRQEAVWQTAADKYLATAHLDALLQWTVVLDPAPDA